MRGDVSSQFITGLLFILPLMEEDSELIITTHMESKSYVDMTLSVLADFGIRVENEAYRRFIIPGGQKYRATRYRVEGDFSQAAFFLCADAMGSAVQVEDLKRDSLQGDSAVLDILQRMGAEVCQEDGTVCCRPMRCTRWTSTLPNARTSFRWFRWRRRCARAQRQYEMQGGCASRSATGCMRSLQS